MSKFIDAEKLRSVLQNTINSMKEKDVKGERYDAFLNGKLPICEELLGCIDSLQQEQPEVDAEWMAGQGVSMLGRIGIYGVDVESITKELREAGFNLGEEIILQIRKKQ